MMNAKLKREMAPHKKKLVDLTTGDPKFKLQIKVWWIPQVPMAPFEVIVSSFAQAKALLETLAQYDLFQLANNIKPDYSNAGGICVQEHVSDDGPEWVDYDGSDFRYSGHAIDEDFDRITMEQCLEMDRKHADMVAALMLST